MSDFPPLGSPTPPPSPTGGAAPGWWQASDGNWYPPDQLPGGAPTFGAPPPYGAPPGYGVPPGYGYGYPPAVGTNGYAIAALISPLVMCGIGSIFGVIFGHMAMNQIKKTGENGRGMALAGLIIGYVSLVLVIAAIILVIAFGESSSNEFQPVDNEFGLGWVLR